MPKALIKTSDGGGTIPDGFVIDLASRKWYLVEAELIQHSVWSHIAPQVTKQMIASQQTITKKILEDLLAAYHITVTRPDPAVDSHPVPTSDDKVVGTRRIPCERQSHGGCWTTPGNNPP